MTIVAMTHDKRRMRRPVYKKTKHLLLILAVVFLPLVISKKAEYKSNNSLDERQAEKDLNALTTEEFDRCVNDLFHAAEIQSHDYNFDIPTFLTFVTYRSNGLLVNSKFTVEILGLVHIYWFIVCTINHDTCHDDPNITVQQIMDHKDSDGIHLSYKLCKRVDLYLERNGFTESPTQLPTVRMLPSYAPIDRQSKAPSLEPIESLSDAPTDGNVSSVMPSARQSYRPTSRPSVVITSGPSNSMSSTNPTGLYSNAPSIPMSNAPSASSTTRSVTVDMEYDIQFSTACLRFVFYDQVLMTVRDALNCADVTCPYGISIILILKEEGEHDSVSLFRFCNVLILTAHSL